MKIKKLFVNPFTLWLLVTAICVVGMFVIGSAEWSKRLSGWIMFLFMVLPVRQWLCKLLDWLVDYLSNLNDDWKAKLQVVFAYNALTGDPSKKTKNTTAYHAMHVIVLIVCILVGLLFMMFSGLSLALVLSWLQTIEYFVCGKLAAWRMFFFIILTIVVLVGIGILVYNILKENIDLHPVLLAVFFGIIAVNILLDTLLLKWTAAIFWAKIAVWFVILILIPAIIFGIIWIIGKIRNH